MDLSTIYEAIVSVCRRIKHFFRRLFGYDRTNELMTKLNEGSEEVLEVIEIVSNEASLAVETHPMGTTVTNVASAVLFKSNNDNIIVLGNFICIENGS